MKSRLALLFGLLVAAWLAVGALSLTVGTTGEGLSGAWALALQPDGSHAWRTFLSDLLVLAMPRLLLGTLAGASLAVAGAMFQALFRNPLASPYTMGISSGASLAAAVTITVAGGGRWYGPPKGSVAAFGGALVCVFIVYGVARLRRAAGPGTLLLTGITIGFICSACIVLVLFLAREHDLAQVLQWMMGSLEVIGMDPVYEAAAMAVLAGGAAAWMHRDLDLLMMGETVAASRGVSVRRSRWVAYLAGSLLTAAIVGHCGPIGFVGLIVPHAMRFAVGPVHRRLLPACALGGAVFLPACDLLARNIMWWLRDEPRQMPVGVLTNLLGGAFFLYLLLSPRRRTGEL